MAKVLDGTEAWTVHRMLTYIRSVERFKSLISRGSTICSSSQTILLRVMYAGKVCGTYPLVPRNG